MKRQHILKAALVGLVLTVSLSAAAETLPDYGVSTVPKQAKEYCPNLDRGYPEKVLWGDSHLHTGWLTDAGFMGAITGPEEAYRFARGEEVVSSHGVRTRLIKPYDWLVVADHAENRAWRQWPARKILLSCGYLLAKKWQTSSNRAKLTRPIPYGSPLSMKVEIPSTTRLSEALPGNVLPATPQYNQPGVFSAIIGFEWTANPGGNNMHRNVIYRNGKGQADRMLPFSNFDSIDPEDLWKWMATYEEKTGGQLLAIPHNGNLSNGLMFDDVTLSGKELSRDYAERRMRWEPIYEVTQMKGDGEAHPMLSPSDEFADYGTWDKGSFWRGQGSRYDRS